MDTEQATQWGIYRLGWEGQPDVLITNSVDHEQMEEMMDVLEQAQRNIRGQLKYRLMELKTEVRRV